MPSLEQFPIPPALVEHILLGPAHDRRVLQDSPVLGDVWLAYAADPGSIQDLLITPHKEVTSAAVASRISSDLGRKGANIAYLQGIVAARLNFEELLRVLVPLTLWWRQRNIAAKLEALDLDELLRRVRQILAPQGFYDARRRAAGQKVDVAYENFSSLDRYIALAGLILWVGKQKRPADDRLRQIEIDEVFRKYESKIDAIVAALLAFYPTVGTASRDSGAATGRAGGRERQGEEDDDRERPLIFQISLNRRTTLALDKSVPAVKADAARTLFEVKCNKIVWAVLDSGIDGGHDAFKTAQGRSRVKKTFDFTNIRDIISEDNANIDGERFKELMAGVGLSEEEVRGRLKMIADEASNKRPINWDVVEELITLSNPPTPVNPHGTHVAGIIGADQLGNNKQGNYPGGMCPDIGLYDFRVLGESLEETEFAIIAALQYIRYVNERHSYITIHGANLSLSIPHSVRNYACGRTPVCVECERLVESGVVVVAAAGNRGYQAFETKDGTFEGYAAFSITDPGNGDGVITVGATHGNWPHTYGVSFFSSRGPTGDGRLKPDLVAPGERVQSTIPNNDWGSESGTSMAAPHVSGAAAMLLARYAEMIGQPRRVKRILCESATDLGRERSFQGYGMLDVLRAFQSI